MTTPKSKSPLPASSTMIVNYESFLFLMHNPSAYKNSPPRKYGKELCDEGLVSKTVDKKEIYEFIDSADPEEIEKLHEEIRQLKEEKH